MLIHYFFDFDTDTEEQDEESEVEDDVSEEEQPASMNKLEKQEQDDLFLNILRRHPPRPRPRIASRYLSRGYGSTIYQRIGSRSYRN